MTDDGIFSSDQQRPYVLHLSAGEVRLLTRLVVKASFQGSEVVRAARLLSTLGELRKMADAGKAGFIPAAQIRAESEYRLADEPPNAS